jgi:hypothetical protein
MAELKKITLDDDIYESLKVQRRTIGLLTGVERSMEDFVSILAIIGSVSLGRAMTPKTDVEMDDFILSLMAQPGAEEAGFVKRMYKSMTAQRGTGFKRE